MEKADRREIGERQECRGRERKEGNSKERRSEGEKQKTAN